MRKPLTDELKKKYIENMGVSCPFCCDCMNLEGGPVEVDAGEAWQEIKCTSCGEEWTDLYTLTGIERTYEDDYDIDRIEEKEAAEAPLGEGEGEDLPKVV